MAASLCATTRGARRHKIYVHAHPLAWEVLKEVGVDGGCGGNSAVSFFSSIFAFSSVGEGFGILYLTLSRVCEKMHFTLPMAKTGAMISVFGSQFLFFCQFPRKNVVLASEKECFELLVSVLPKREARLKRSQ